MDAAKYHTKINETAHHKLKEELLLIHRLRVFWEWREEVKMSGKLVQLTGTAECTEIGMD